MKFFSRYPPAGQLYEAFKNANRRLSWDLKLRQHKGTNSKSTEAEQSVKTPISEQGESKGRSF